MKLTGVQFLMSVALSGQAYMEKRRSNDKRSRQLFAEAADNLQSVSAAYERRLGSGHPTLFMSDSFLMDCLDELERYSEAITIQQRIVAVSQLCFGTFKTVDETENLADLHVRYAKAKQNVEALRQALQMYTDLVAQLDEVSEELSDEQLQKFRPRFQRKQKNCEQLLVKFNDTSQSQSEANPKALP